MNKLDLDYQNLVRDILEVGHKKGDRTGTGTISVFGRSIRHKMSNGKFPILTTKKMYFKGIVTELLWFLKGDSNIKHLLENDCNIWTGDAYSKYVKCTSANDSVWNKWMRNNGDGTLSMFRKDEFIQLIQTNDEFGKMWGELGPVYGKLWRDWNGRKTNGFIEYENNGFNENIKGIDQITNLINDLRKNPDSRRLMVTAWNPSELPNQTLPPCHYGFQCYTRELSGEERYKNHPELLKVNKDKLDAVKNNEYENAARFRGIEKDLLLKLPELPTRSLSISWSQRSCDFPLGIPFNIASYGLLLTILGKMVNMIPEELIGNFGDSHVYLNQIEGIKEQLDRTPYDLPTIEISDRVNFNGTIDDMLNSCDYSDFKLINYQSHPTIKLPLSN